MLVTHFSELFVRLLSVNRALADTDSDGKMNINEFSIACKLINLKLHGMEVPKKLPPTLLASLTDGGVVGGPTPTMTPRGSTSSMSPIDPLHGIAAVPVVPSPVPVVPEAVAAPAVVPQVPVAPVAVAATVPAGIVSPPQSNPPSRHMSISERAPSIESP